MYRILFLGFVCLFFSCKKTQEKPQEKTQSPFTNIHLPEMENSSLPFLFSDGNDLLLSFVSRKDSLVTLYYSKLTNKYWSNPEAITSGSDWFINWADYPQIGKNGKSYIAHILQKSDEATYAYDVMITQKQEGGEWSMPFKIHNDTTKTEHGFVSYSPFGESQFLISWLDGRNTSGNGHDHNGGAMTIRAALVNSDGTLENEYLLDDRVCDCCQTSTAMTSKGPVVVYRDRSEKEVRDISFVRMEGDKWTKPVVVYEDNWEIAGCPVNGPRIAAKDNNVAVAWFTAANGESAVKLAFSKNYGERFEKPLKINFGVPLGRVDVAFIDSENAVISWMEDDGQNTFVKFRKVTVDGKLGNVMTLTSADASRTSGFPQMAVLNEKVYFAWTSIKDENLSVKTKYLASENF